MIEQSYISPFMTSIQNVFSTMLQLPVEIGEPVIKTKDTLSQDVSGIISLYGEMQGVVAMSMQKEVAIALVNLFTGESHDLESPDFSDALGELVNMISGNAKAEFQLKSVSISCPTVVVGAHHRVSPPPGAACVSIPCATDCGDVSLEISICERSDEESGTDNIAA